MTLFPGLDKCLLSCTSMVLTLSPQFELFGNRNFRHDRPEMGQGVSADADLSQAPSLR